MYIFLTVSVIYRFTLNKILTALGKNSTNSTIDVPDVEIAIVPPQEEGVTDMDTDDSDNQVTGRFCTCQDGY